jgi:hypothetical protein
MGLVPESTPQDLGSTHLMGLLSTWMIFLHRFSPSFPQPDSPAAAVAVVQQNIAMETDIVKLFVGSYDSPDDIIHMPMDIA